jgi:hypothetical protein
MAVLQQRRCAPLSWSFCYSEAQMTLFGICEDRRMSLLETTNFLEGHKDDIDA